MLRQEASLRAGQLGELPAIAREQMEILSNAESLMFEIQQNTTRSDPAFQKGIQDMAAVLSEIVASEERCKEFARPPQDPQHPPARVLAAYGKR